MKLNLHPSMLVDHDLLSVGGHDGGLRAFDNGLYGISARSKRGFSRNALEIVLEIVATVTLKA
jgi:hypothetical protein